MVVVSDNDILIRVEPVKTNTTVVPFLHCEVLEWNKSTRKKCVDFLNSIATAYVLVTNSKLLKFCKLLGAKELTTTERGTFVRFN